MLTWSELFGARPTVLTVVGMAKNAGKTVTMNYVQSMLRAAGETLGLTSVGRDGERFDELTLLTKPAVGVVAGTIVATARDTVEEPDAWQYLAETSLQTPLGPVVLLKAKRATRVVLAGPSKNSEIKAVVKGLADWGATVQLIDGAFDRQSAADPTVSKQVILATGATLCRQLEPLVELTRARVEQLSLPACAAGQAQAWRGAAARIIVEQGGAYREVVGATTLLSQDEWREILGRSGNGLLLKGAVSDGLAEALLAATTAPQVVVADGSKVFIRPELWRRLRHKGIAFAAVKPIVLLGVSVNPTFPGGAGLDPDELLTAMGKALAPLPVIDIFREKLYRTTLRRSEGGNM